MIIVASFFDARGTVIETVEGPAEEVINKAARFMLLHGTDPDENGAAAAPGSIEFEPVVP